MCKKATTTQILVEKKVKISVKNSSAPVLNDARAQRQKTFFSPLNLKHYIIVAVGQCHFFNLFHFFNRGRVGVVNPIHF